MTDRLMLWLWRVGRQPRPPTDRDDASREEIAARQEAVAVRLRALQARADAKCQPPREPPRD